MRFTAGVYGKVHDVIDEHKKTGDLMPVLTHLGPAAPAGLTRYESDVFGKDYRDNLFAALFNLHKITRHVLEPAGATYKSADSDFVVSDNTDFHPTDVIEDADGSLLVVDTGGWYKLCCPTSQLWKPDVLGAIYRIRRNGSPKIDDPRGTKINWANASASELTALLADKRPVVVKRAVQHLRQTKGSADELAAVLKGQGTDRQKINAVWALASNPDPKAAPALWLALENNSTVRHAALHALAVTPEKANAGVISELLSENQPAPVRRAAAELLGRTRSAAAVSPLLHAAGELERNGSNELPDRTQEHSIIYALIEISAGNETRVGLSSSNSLTRRAALIALDQMATNTLKPADVVPLLTSNDAVLKQTANWIIAHRKDWGADLAGYFEQRLKAKSLTTVDRASLAEQISRLASTPAIQELVRGAAGDEAAPTRNARGHASAHGPRGIERDAALMDQCGYADPRHKEGSRSEDAVTAAGAFQFKQTPGALKDQLTRVASDNGHDAQTRLRALSAVSGSSELGPELFQFVRAQLGTEAAAERRLAASILAKAPLNEEQFVELCADVQRAWSIGNRATACRVRKGFDRKSWPGAHRSAEAILCTPGVEYRSRSARSCQISRFHQSGGEGDLSRIK